MQLIINLWNFCNRCRRNNAIVIPKCTNVTFFCISRLLDSDKPHHMYHVKQVAFIVPLCNIITKINKLQPHETLLEVGYTEKSSNNRGIRNKTNNRVLFTLDDDENGDDKEATSFANRQHRRF